jgi:hypothetical protein
MPAGFALPVRGPTGRKALLWFLLGLALPALLFPIASALYFGSLLRELDVREWKRLPNVRAVPQAVEVAVVRHFAREAAADHAASGRRQRVLMIGDSQLFGYFHPAGNVVSAHLGRLLPEASVYNMAKVGASAGWLDATLRHALAEGLRPDVLVINANPGTNSDLDSSQREWASRSPEFAFLVCGECTRTAAKLLRDKWEGTFRQPDLLDRHNVPPGDGSFQMAQVRKNYYRAEHAALLSAGIVRVLARAQREGIRAVVYVSPHWYAPYNQPPYSYGWDTEPLLRRVLDDCRKFDHAICLDPTPAFARGHFHDLIHLNPQAHEALAAMLAPHVRTQLARRPAAP